MYSMLVLKIPFIQHYEKLCIYVVKLFSSNIPFVSLWLISLKLRVQIYAFLVRDLKILFSFFLPKFLILKKPRQF